MKTESILSNVWTASADNQSVAGFPVNPSVSFGNGYVLNFPPAMPLAMKREAAEFIARAPAMRSALLAEIAAVETRIAECKESEARNPDDETWSLLTDTYGEAKDALYRILTTLPSL